MSGRPSKRARVLASEDDDSEGTDFVPERPSTSPPATFSSSAKRTAKAMPRATRRSAQAASFESSSTTPPSPPPASNLSLTRSNSAGTSRSRRAAAAAAAQVSARSTQDASKQSIRLTVKAPPSRLREVTTNRPSSRRERLGRSSKRAPIIDKSESSDEDAEGDEVEEDDVPVDDEEEDEEDEGDVDDDEDEEDEDEEDEELPAPRIRINVPSTARKPSPGQLLKQTSATKSVEEKEMQEATSDEELSSELEEDEEEEDAEGDEDEEDEEDAEDDEMELDEDGANETINSTMIGDEELDSHGEDSESGTPDPAKLTRRQRGDADSDLMALSNEAQKKKFFTAEQITMRRAEMARRRKDLSDKRNQNEKEDTLRRLLHKPAPKRRSRAQMMADAEKEEFGTPGLEGEEARPSKLFVRTVMRADGTTVSVPEEWLGTPAGSWYEKTKKQDLKQTSAPRMVQVIE